MKLCQVFANVITYAKLTFRCDNFVKLLVLQLFSTKRVVAFYLATFLLMLINLTQLVYLITEFTGNPKRINDLLDNSTGTSNADIFLTYWAVLV